MASKGAGAAGCTHRAARASPAVRHSRQLTLACLHVPAPPLFAWLQAALMAMARGRDFTIKVKPLQGSGRSGGGSASGAAAAPARAVLTIRFRPAESDQLRAAMPHIGVPAWVGAGSSDDAVALLSAAALQAGAGKAHQAGAGGAAQVAKGPSYYFGESYASLSACSHPVARPAGSSQGAPMPGPAHAVPSPPHPQGQRHAEDQRRMLFRGGAHLLRPVHAMCRRGAAGGAGGGPYAQATRAATLSRSLAAAAAHPLAHQQRGGVPGVGHPLTAQRRPCRGQGGLACAQQQRARERGQSASGHAAAAAQHPANASCPSCCGIPLPTQLRLGGLAVGCLPARCLP